MILGIILLLITVFLMYLFFQIQKIKKNMVTFTENDKGELILKYKSEEVYNYKLNKQ